MSELIFYSTSSGDTLTSSLDTSGHETIQSSAVKLSAGWTYLVASGKELMFYNFGSGDIATTTLDPDGRYFEQRYGKLLSGFTHLVGVDGLLLLFNSATGHLETARITDDGFYVPLDKGNLPGVWTHVALAKVLSPFGTELLLYNAKTGKAQTASISSGGHYTSQHSFDLSLGWTHVVGVSTEMFFYNACTGTAQTARVDSDGNFIGQEPATFPMGASHVVASGANILFYDSGTGNEWTGFLDYDGHYTSELTGRHDPVWDVVVAQPRAEVVPKVVRFAVVPVSWTDSKPADMRPLADFDWVFTAAGKGRMNIVDYFHENSNGHLDISGSKVFPWTPVAMSSVDWYTWMTGKNPTGGYDQVLELLKSKIDLTGYDRVIVIVAATGQASAGWGVLGRGAALASSDEQMAPSMACQEMIHSLGFEDIYKWHTRGFGGDDYSDPYDVMGLWQNRAISTPWGRPGQAAGPGVNAASMFLFGWLSESRTYHVPARDTSVTIDLRPLHWAQFSGPLCIRAGQYFFSYRPKSRWDAGYPNSMVQVHEIITADVQLGTGHVSNFVAELKAGQTFDVGVVGDTGTFVRVESIDDNTFRARIHVEHRVA